MAATLASIRRDWTSKPPLGVRLRTDGHWSVPSYMAFPLNDGGGSSVRELVNYHNGAVGSTGKLGPLGFTGINDANSVINIGNGFNGLTNFTIVSAVTSTQTSVQATICGVGYNGTNTEWTLGINSSGQLFFSTYTGGSNQGVTSASTISGRTLVASSVKLGKWDLYTGDSLNATANPGIGPINTGMRLSIGAIASGGSSFVQPWQGLIEFVYIYTPSLLPAQILTILANPYQIFEPQITWAVIPSGATTYNLFFSDYGSGLDLSALSSIGRSLAEAGNAVDADALSSIGRSLAEAGNAVDTEVNNLAVAKGVTEAGNAVDIETENLATPETVNEAGNAVDVDALSSIGRSLAEAGNAVDADALSSIGRSLAEAGNAVDTEVNNLAVAKGVTEAGNAVDIETENLATPETVNEAGKLLDSQSETTAGVTGTIGAFPFRTPWTSKPPLGIRLRTDGHWSTRGLVQCLALNEFGGALAFDLTGGSIENIVTPFVWDSVGSAFPGVTGLQLSGGGFINAGYPINYSLTSGYTLCALFATSTSATQVIFCDGGGSTYIVTNPFPELQSKTAHTTSTTSVADGKPHFICGVQDSTNIYMWRDGILDGQTPSAGNTTAPPMITGRYYTGSTYFTGIIGLTAVYNRALSPPEIQSLSANPWQIFEPQTSWIGGIIPGATNVSESIAEYGAGADTEALSSIGRSLAEAGNAVDVDALSSIGRSLAEAGNAVDVDALSSIGRSLAEAGNAVDTETESLATPETISEAGNAVDTQTQAAGIGENIVEQGAVRDTNAQITTLAQLLTEIGVATDTPTSTTFSLAIVESAYAAEALTSFYTAGVTVLETGHLADIVSQGGALAQLIAESGHGADIFTITSGSSYYPAYYSNLSILAVATLSQLAALSPAAVAGLTGIVYLTPTTVAKVSPATEVNPFPGTITPIL